MGWLPNPLGWPSASPKRNLGVARRPPLAPKGGSQPPRHQGVDARHPRQPLGVAAASPKG